MSEGFDLQHARKVAGERLQPFDTKYVTRLRRELRDVLTAYEGLEAEHQRLEDELAEVTAASFRLLREREAAARELGRFRMLIEKQPVS